MRWFRNLNAAPRLMSSFGIVLLLTLAMGYLAISALSAANDRVEGLYRKDMAGMMEADEMTIDILPMARDALHATIHAAEPETVAADEREEMATTAKLHFALDSARQHFVTPKGLEQVNNAMTQMDQVTQSNSAQTEELSATAQSLSEQSARLLELVDTFRLSNDDGKRREQRGFTPREAGPVLSVGARLVSSANMALSDGGTHSAAMAKRPVKATRSSGLARSSPGPSGVSLRASKSSVIRRDVVVAASTPGGSDVSFEEF